MLIGELLALRWSDIELPARPPQRNDEVYDAETAKNQLGHTSKTVHVPL